MHLLQTQLYLPKILLYFFQNMTVSSNKKYRFNVLLISLYYIPEFSTSFLSTCLVLQSRGGGPANFIRKNGWIDGGHSCVQ